MTITAVLLSQRTEKIYTLVGLWILLSFISGGLIGGYFSWFASQKVAIEFCSRLKVLFR